MKVIISDDYQDCVRTLDCYPALVEHFDVDIHHDTVTSLDAQAERFADADALLLVRERTPVGANLLARLPKLKFISQTGRAANHVDLAWQSLAACVSPRFSVASRNTVRWWRSSPASTSWWRARAGSRT